MCSPFKPSQEAYRQALRDPRWQRRRLEILERDGWRCMECGDGATTLHVHHRCYVRGHLPWESPDTDLETLCEACHQREHLRNFERLVDALHQIDLIEPENLAWTLLQLFAYGRLDDVERFSLVCAVDQMLDRLQAIYRKHGEGGVVSLLEALDAVLDRSAP